MSADPQLISFDFDYKNPDYGPIIRARIARLARIRQDPAQLPALKLYYRDHIAQFLSDWAVTSDPRNSAKGLAVVMPFILFPKQVELVDWTVARWQRGESGTIVKSRDIGASWLIVCVAASLCLFHRDLTIGIGSAREDKIARSGDPDCLKWKLVTFLKHLPTELRGGFDETKHSAHMRVVIPETGSSITGEAGDQIGRGGRKAIYFIDEAAHIERPQLIDASLASTTNCRIAASSVNGIGNSFAERARSGKIPRFDFSWRSDPRKDADWYAKMCRDLDPIVVAQEIDCDFQASTEGQLIPSSWVQAAVDAHKKLDIDVTGTRVASFDPADQGGDKNAFAARRGILLERVHSWSGKNSDIFASTVKAFALCREADTRSLYIDADGLGAGAIGDARRINDGAPEGPIHVTPFRGSAAVESGMDVVVGRRNEDYFANLKAQSWIALRKRFEATDRAIRGQPYVADDLISISSECGELTQLILELSQPSYHLNNSGKILIDKTPDGARSPNLGDCIMMAYSPLTRKLEMWTKLGRPVL